MKFRRGWGSYQCVITNLGFQHVADACVEAAVFHFRIQRMQQPSNYKPYRSFNPHKHSPADLITSYAPSTTGFGLARP